MMFALLILLIMGYVATYLVFGALMSVIVKVALIAIAATLVWIATQFVRRRHSN